MSRDAVQSLRRLFGSLPWETLGERALLVTLLSPSDWRRWVWNGDVWEAQRRAFENRWERRWGPLLGVWVKEFQERGAPHLHLYVQCPAAVSDEAYEVLRERTERRRRLESVQGRRARAGIEAVSGDFGWWARTAWAEVVTGGGGAHKTRLHHARGVDVATMDWQGSKATEERRLRAVDYLMAEVGKAYQKRAPDGFDLCGRRWSGRWGRNVGFHPQEECVQVPTTVYVRLERVLCRWVRLQCWVAMEVVIIAMGVIGSGILV